MTSQGGRFGHSPEEHGEAYRALATKTLLFNDQPATVIQTRYLKDYGVTLCRSAVVKLERGDRYVLDFELVAIAATLRRTAASIGSRLLIAHLARGNQPVAVPKRNYAPEPRDGFIRLGAKKSSITHTVSLDDVRALRYVARISRLKPRRLLALAIAEVAGLAYSGHDFATFREACKTARAKTKALFRKYSGPEDLLVDDMGAYLKKCHRLGVEPDLGRAFPGSGLISRARAYKQLQHLRDESR